MKVIQSQSCAKIKLLSNWVFCWQSYQQLCSHSFHRMTDLSQSHQLKDPESERPGPSNPPNSRISVDNSWSCLKCTLINQKDAKVCKVCEASKPVEDDFWSCFKCTLINKKDAKVCNVCEASKPVEDDSTNQLHCGSSEDKEEVQQNKKKQNPLEEAMTSGLECPVCWADMRDHIFQCKNGHLVCQTCWRKLKNVLFAEPDITKGFQLDACLQNRWLKILEATDMFFSLI